MKHPKQPNFMGSMLPDDGCPMLVNILILYILPCYCIAFMYCNLLCYAGIFFIYGVLVVPFVLFEFRVGRKPGKYFAVPNLRKPPTLQIAWRTVQVLQLNINNMLGVFLVPTHTFFGDFCVLSTYILFKHHKMMATSTKVMLVIWAGLSSFFWCLVLLMGGYIHMFGIKVLTSWKYYKWSEITAREKRILSRFGKSCVPLSIAYGKTFVIRRLTVLKFIRGLVKGIFRTLLTIGKSNR